MDITLHCCVEGGIGKPSHAAFIAVDFPSSQEFDVLLDTPDTSKSYTLLQLC